MNAEMTEWMKEMARPDSLIVVGAGMVAVGFAIAMVSRTPFAAKCDAVRQALKAEAQSMGQTDRLERLKQEEAGIRKMPRRGKALMIAGGVICAIGVAWFIAK